MNRAMKWAGLIWMGMLMLGFLFAFLLGPGLSFFERVSGGARG